MKNLLIIFFILTGSHLFSDSEIYTKKLFDTHTHVGLVENPNFSIIKKLFKKNKVKWAVALNQDINPNDTLKKIKKDTKKIKNKSTKGYTKFIPFLDIDDNNPSDLNLNNLNYLLTINKVDNTFIGMGENAFYRDPLITSNLTDQTWLDVFSWGESNAKIIMIHIRNNLTQIDEIPTILENYPNCKVLLHGIEYINDPNHQKLINMLTTYPNLYFTLDTATLLYYNNYNLMFPPENNSQLISDQSYHFHATPDDCNDDNCDNELTEAEIQKANQFVSTYDSTESLMLQSAYDTYLPILQAAPDHVCWGTDFAENWHRVDEVYLRLIQFTRKFIAMLPEELQKKYAYKNAKLLLN